MPQKKIDPLDKNKFFKVSSYLTGFTLLEVLISIILLVLTLGGLTSLFVSGKRILLHTQYRITGGELGKVFLDPLQMQVNQDDWGSSCLSTPVVPVPPALCPGPESPLGSFLTWTPHYAIDNVIGTDLRRVVLTVDIPERQP